MVQDEAHATGGAIHTTNNKSTMPSQQKQSPVMRIVIYIVLIGLLVGGGFYVAGLLKKDDAKVKKEGAVPVTVATAKSQVIPIEIRSIGNVLPYSLINVVPQVSGQLAKVNFTQGQFVKKGDLLFQIEPGPYQAAVNQSTGTVDKDIALVEQARANMARDNAAVGQLRANKARDEAQLKFANAEMGRYLTLQKEGVVSNEQKDQIDTNGTAASATIDADQKAIENALAVVRADKAAIETAQGTLEADKAARDNAKIQLSWCQIRSPIDGRTSSLAVYQGNVVTANAATTPLVTIAQVKPIYINFTVPEQYLDEVRRNMAAHTLNVDVLVEGIRKNAVLGAVSFLESTVNTQTGTVVMRASFENTDLRLFPGQFVDVIVTMPPEGQTVVVPVTALQTTQQGTAVYTVGADGTVSFCPVEVERTQKDLAAIGKGIKAGDVVVTDGQLQLVPGAKVKVIKDATVADTRLNSIKGMHDTTSASSAAAMNTVSSQKDSANGANLPGNDKSNSDSDQNGPVSDVGRAAVSGGSVNGKGYSAIPTAPDGSNSFAGHHANAPADKALQSTASELNPNDFKNNPEARAKASHDGVDSGPGTYKIKGNAQGQ